MKTKTTKQDLIDDLASARRWHDQHQQELRSKNKRVRARALRLERRIQRLDREIAEALSGAWRSPR